MHVLFIQQLAQQVAQFNLPAIGLKQL